MQLFKCTNCANPIYFENTFCGNCNYPVGFLAETMSAITLTPDHHYKYCANHEYDACNWLISKFDNAVFCKACELNRIIPWLGIADNKSRWQKIEIAKHRLIYSLLKMKLPLMSKLVDYEKGLAFDFVANTSANINERVITGHDNGLITLNISEADDVERKVMQQSMNEVYRTLLGHFRHEIGHYYWKRLIDGTNIIDRFRALFGDERDDYGTALYNHYQKGSPANWNQHYISMYASAHPWEDWAETWAHYMHILDTLETAYSFGLSVDPLVADEGVFNANITNNPYYTHDFENIMRQWLPLTFAMNSLNRSMGLPDIYPFFISNAVQHKMRFIHEVVFHRSSLV